MANSIPFAQRTSGLEVIGESEKATNLKQINAAKINCKLDIWVWGDSGIKKRERKKPSTLDLQVPWLLFPFGIF